MFNTLKGKITLIYFFLVFIIAVVGISSVLSFYRLSKSINGLMVDNYRSINASRHMLEALGDQNMMELNYIYTNDQTSLIRFYQGGSTFYKWYNLESSNITEKGEKSIVDKINILYQQYQSELPQVKAIMVKNGTIASVNYYNKSILPTFNELKNGLRDITSLNEKAMFERKYKVTSLATKSMYLIMILSASVILIGFILSNLLTNRFLKPLYVLKETIKAVREGNLEQQASVLSNDEIGDLAAEFNKMTYRLKQFENSSKGKLLEEKNKSVAIIKSISDPVIVLDINYKVVLLNHACEIFFKTNEKEAINKHFLEVIRNSDIYDHIAFAYNSEADKYKPKIVSVKFGEKEFFFDTVVTKVKDDESKLKGMVVLFQNVTNLKKLEKTKTDFVSSISHEFKTPLTSIIMGTSLLKSEGLGKLSNKQIEVLSAIEDDAESLSLLVNDIIQLSKLESDKALFNFESHPLYEIVDNCINGFSDISYKGSINLYSTVSRNLPRVYADYEKISWVINNLISNAIKFSSLGGKIHIDASVENNFTQISVSDTGIGIPLEYQNKIFDRFIRVEPSDSEIKGTGLGLAIAKEIVTAHGGSIWCKSTPGEGSTFFFTVPLAY